MLRIDASDTHVVCDLERTVLRLLLDPGHLLWNQRLLVISPDQTVTTFSATSMLPCTAFEYGQI